MKMSRLIFALVCLVGLTQLVWSQDKEMGLRERGIPGYLNPRTSTFTTRAQSQSSEAAPTAPVYYYGAIVIKLTVFVASSFPAGTVFVCSGSASTFDSGGGDFFEEATAVAPAPQNYQTNCTLTMNYYWQLSTPTTDSVNISFSVEADNTGSVGNQTKVIALRVAERTPLGFTGVPSDGTITTLNYQTRL
jgi:hypothetical protein